MEQKKLVRDANTERDTVADVAGAMQENFWANVKKDQEIEVFTGEAFYKDVARLVKKYQNTERKTAEDVTAMAAVNSVADLLKAKAPALVM